MVHGITVAGGSCRITSCAFSSEKRITWCNHFATSGRTGGTWLTLQTLAAGPKWEEEALRG